MGAVSSKRFEHLEVPSQFSRSPLLSANRSFGRIGPIERIDKILHFFPDVGSRISIASSRLALNGFQPDSRPSFAQGTNEIQVDVWRRLWVLAMRQRSATPPCCRVGSCLLNRAAIRGIRGRRSKGNRFRMLIRGMIWCGEWYPVRKSPCDRVATTD